jgi:hypothetical protein
LAQKPASFKERRDEYASRKKYVKQSLTMHIDGESCCVAYPQQQWQSSCLAGVFLITPGFGFLGSKQAVQRRESKQFNDVHTYN